MVSAFAENAKLMREAFAGRQKPSEFQHLATRTDVDRYFSQRARVIHPGFRHVMLLDIDTAPEASWWFVERSATRHLPPALTTIALVSPNERALAEARFGTSVSSYLPIPETPRQAQRLAEVIDAI